MKRKILIIRADNLATDVISFSAPYCTDQNKIDAVKVQKLAERIILMKQYELAPFLEANFHFDKFQMKFDPPLFAAGALEGRIRKSWQEEASRNAWSPPSGRGIKRRGRSFSAYNLLAMAPTQALIFLALTVTVKCYDVKLGLLLPHNDDGAIKYRMGYSTSAAAVTIALDRVQKEQLLPDANIR